MIDLPRRLIRLEVDSIERTIRPLMFSFARSISAALDVARGDVGDLLDRDLDAGREVLLARADVEPDLARVGVLGRERVDRIGHAPLLADLLEEARRRRAAEDRVQDRDGEAPPVGARDPGRADADVVLLRVLAQEAQRRRRRLHERAAHVRGAARTPPGVDAARWMSSTSGRWSTIPGGGDDDVPAAVHRRW